MSPPCPGHSQADVFDIGKWAKPDNVTLCPCKLQGRVPLEIILASFESLETTPGQIGFRTLSSRACIGTDPTRRCVPHFEPTPSPYVFSSIPPSLSLFGDGCFGRRAQSEVQGAEAPGLRVRSAWSPAHIHHDRGANGRPRRWSGLQAAESGRLAGVHLPPECPPRLDRVPPHHTSQRWQRACGWGCTSRVQRRYRCSS